MANYDVIINDVTTGDISLLAEALFLQGKVIYEVYNFMLQTISNDKARLGEQRNENCFSI